MIVLKGQFGNCQVVFLQRSSERQFGDCRVIFSQRSCKGQYGSDQVVFLQWLRNDNLVAAKSFSHDGSKSTIWWSPNRFLAMVAKG